MKKINRRVVLSRSLSSHHLKEGENFIQLKTNMNRSNKGHSKLELKN